MKRYLKIFLFYLQSIFTERGRSFVWLLVAIIPPIIMYTYWRAALASNGGQIAGWNLSTISSYYFLLIVASSCLMAHIENEVSYEDIQQGQLVRYVLKPFPYFFFSMFLETPYRFLQGFYAIIAVLIFVAFFGNFFAFATNPTTIFLAVLIAILGFILSFLYKMIIGFAAFWLTDVGGFHQLLEGIMFICGGFLLPLSLLPEWLAHIAYFLPFAYMIYYPIVAFQGTQTIPQLLTIIAIQLSWIGAMGLLYRFVFAQGIKKFTGVGN